MVLLWIFIGLLIVATYAGYRYDDAGGASFGFIIGGFLLSLIFFVIQVIGVSASTTTSAAHYSQKIVSLRDGSQVEGNVTGSMFLVRGQIGEKQYFSYYKKNDDGSYSLDKRDSNYSTIWADATAEAARVDITDTIYHCSTSWWVAFCPAQLPDFAHADFHVPPNSIKQDYVLDAQ